MSHSIRDVKECGVSSTKIQRLRQLIRSSAKELFEEYNYEAKEKEEALSTIEHEIFGTIVHSHTNDIMDAEKSVDRLLAEFESGSGKDTIKFAIGKGATTQEDLQEISNLIIDG